MVEILNDCGAPGGPSDQPENNARILRPRALMQDVELVAAAQAGDERAFECLMERHAPAVQGFLYGFPAVRSELDDLLQEVFILAWRNIARLRRPDRFTPWLYRIARNRANEHLRGRKRGFLLWNDVFGEDEAESRIEQTPDPAPGPADLAQAGQAGRLALEAIGRLKDRYRVVVYLSLIDEISSPEIARRLRMKESAVRMRLMRGLKKVREDLERRGYRYESLG